MGVKLRLCLGLCSVMIFAQMKITNVFRQDTQPYHEGSTNDFLNGEYGVRKVGNCKSMFQIGHHKENNSFSSSRIFRGTAYYESLSRLLSFHPQSSFPEASPWSVLRRIEETYAQVLSTDGHLPFLPCVMQDYDADLSRECLEKRLKGGKELWIMFAGDSKIRNTFFAFLNSTRSLEYNISYLNTSGELDDVISKLGDKDVRWTHFYAVSKVNPNLKVTMRFCNFIMRYFEDFNQTKDVQIIRRMAEGEDPVPDLLVTGYSTWTLLLLDWGHIFPNLSILDHMRELVRVLSRLYERLSRRTRVLVLAESRLKPYAPHEQHMRPAIFADAHIDLTDRMFFHYLRQEEKEVEIFERRSLILEKHNPSSKPDWLEADSGGLWWWDSILPHSLAVREICAEMHRHNMTHARQYTQLNCRDTNHDGAATGHLATNMLLNLLCNRVMRLQGDYCCK